MKPIARTFLSLVAAALAFIASAAAANPIIEQAKADCVIGEQADGYLGVVDSGAASEAVRREMRSINQQRRAAYERLAERNGVTVEVTAKLAAQQLIDRAPSGHCVRDDSGAWIRK
ncbi:MAG: YdbL family protein [Amphiplicatus sp.]